MKKMEYFIFSITIVYIVTFYDDFNSIADRINYLKNKSRNVFSKKLDIEYSNSKGIYVISKDNIANNTLLLNVPKEHILCQCII